jgi:hypothetical protein
MNKYFLQCVLTLFSITGCHQESKAACQLCIEYQETRKLLVINNNTNKNVKYRDEIISQAPMNGGGIRIALYKNNIRLEKSCSYVDSFQSENISFIKKGGSISIRLNISELAEIYCLSDKESYEFSAIVVDGNQVVVLESNKIKMNAKD